MDQDVLYFPARSLTLQIADDGGLEARTSISGPALELSAETALVLTAFAGGRSVGEARRTLADDYETDEHELDELLRTLIGQGLLVARGADGPADEPRPTREAFAAWSHLYMLLDTERVNAYRRAIGRHAEGKVVVDLGCGTGILSLCAAEAGARRVIAIEEGPIAEVAAETFAANGCSDVIELRRGNSADVELDEPADLLVHEILGDEAVDENLLPYIADARRRLLRPSGRLLPDLVKICCVGVEAAPGTAFDHAHAIEQARSLSEVHGFDLGPFVAKLARAERRLLLSPMRGGAAAAMPAAMTREAILLELDLRTDLSGLDRWHETSLEVTREGVLGGVLVYFRARLDEQEELTNAPDAPPTSWSWDIRLLPGLGRHRPGDRVRLAARIETIAGEQSLRVEPRL